MPRWVPRAILLFWLGYVAVYVGQGLVHSLRNLLIALLVSLFLSFAIEPLVNRLARRGWRRGGATALVFLGILFVIAVFSAAMGSLVANQVSTFIDEAPDYVRDIETWTNDRFGTDLEFDDLISELNDPQGPARRFAENLAANALSFGQAALAVLFQILTIGLFTFYLVVDGPRLRRVICSRLSPERQWTVLQAWELAIDKTGGYLASRVVLAGLSAAFTWVALAILDVPYALALALWVGIVSQFIPVIGTYLAGGLAVLVATLNDPVDGVLTLAFVVVYQQIENYVFAPRVTATTLSLHPALGFGAVLVGTAMLGVPGALLALPVTAVVAAFVSELGERHEVVESHLTVTGRGHGAAPQAEPRWQRFRRTSPTVPSTPAPLDEVDEPEPPR